jgi:hypothetical protein
MTSPKTNALAPNEQLDHPSAHSPAWARLLIVTLVLIAFGSVARHSFLSWDDDYTITQNPRIVHPSIANTLYYWRHGFMDLYVPVTYTAWSALAWISRMTSGRGDDAPLSPFAFHAASIAVHAINSLLVFALLRRLLKRDWPAVAGALVFALHPVQVETVAWTSGLKDLLCAMFSLIALSQYVAAVSPSEDPQREPSAGNRRLHHALGLLAMLLGMLSKPTAMMTPALAIIIDGLILRRSWRKVIISAAPYLMLVVPCLIWTKLCQPSGFLRPIPFWQRPLIATDALGFYLYKLVLPIHLTFDYGRSPWVAVGKGWAYATWLVPAAVAVALIVFRHRTKPLLAAWLLLIAGVLPVLGLSTFDFEMISTVADHYLYLALIGPALAVAWALTRVASDAKWPRNIACIALALFTVRSAEQSRYWQDSRTMFSHALDLNPESWSSWAGLAYLAHEDGKQLATRAVEEAARGENPIPDRMAADEALREAMEGYRRAISINPSMTAAHHGYGAMLMYFGDYPNAARAFNEVLIRRQVMSPAAQTQFYEDSDLLAQCLLYSGRADIAVKVLRDAMRLRPIPAGVEEHLRAAEAAVAARAKQVRENSSITGTQKETYEDAAGDD